MGTDPLLAMEIPYAIKTAIPFSKLPWNFSIQQHLFAVGVAFNFKDTVLVYCDTILRIE